MKLSLEGGLKMTENKMLNILKAEKLAKKYPKIKKIIEKHSKEVGLNRSQEARYENIT
jgi:hypothetical protein